MYRVGVGVELGLEEVYYIDIIYSHLVLLYYSIYQLGWGQLRVADPTRYLAQKLIWVNMGRCVIVLLYGYYIQSLGVTILLFYIPTRMETTEGSRPLYVTPSRSTIRPHMSRRYNGDSMRTVEW